MPDRLMQIQPETSSCHEISFEAYTTSLVARADKYMVSPFVISTIGGGGKTTTLLDLFLRYDNERFVTLTSTTAMFAPLYCEREFARVAENDSMPDALKTITLGEPPSSSGVWFQHPFDNVEGKYKGIDKDVFDAHVRSFRMSNDPLLIEKEATDPKSGRTPLFLCEADGSKRKPFKAHAPHEPAIPETTDLVLILFGLSGLGKKCTEDVVHRSDLFATAIGIKEEDVITFDHLIKLLKSGMFFKGIPPTSRVAVIFHQTDTLPKDMRSDRKLRTWAKAVLDAPGIDAVFFRGEDPAKNHRIVTYMGLAYDCPSRPLFSSILLAAGTSSRMPGYNKLLLPFGNETVIAHTLRRIFAGPCRDIVIVTGHDADAVFNVIEPIIKKEAPTDVRITVIYNPRYLEGQGTSVASAATVLDESSMACFCVPGDQPFVSPGTMRTLTEKATHDAILVPCREDGSRASPVLFGKDYYDELAALEGDVGGRQVMRRYPDSLQLIKTGGSNLIYEDIDTKERYEHLLKNRPLNR